MARFGFGQRGWRSRAQYAQSAQIPVVRLAPDTSWTGAAGSGFVTPPSDPVRTTAKPAMRLVVPPNQYYTSSLLVGVYAGANNAGSLFDNMGLEKVIAHFEGNAIEISQPSYQVIRDANGQRRSYWGWWVQLSHDGRSGHGNVYFEAVPKDATMQRRVIGPYQFSPQPVQHDVTLIVAPSLPQATGSRYTSITTALAHLKSVSAQNPLIRITEAGEYEIGGASPAYTGAGYCTIVADAPVILVKSGFTTDLASYARTYYDGLKLTGSNIAIDKRFLSAFYHENAAGRLHWFDGIRLFNSASRDTLWRGGPSSRGTARNGAWFTECELSDSANICSGASLVRGCTVDSIFWDVVSDAACVINNRFTNHDSNYFRRDVDCFTLQYTGAETTATLELSGGNDASSRTFTARWGSNSATFTVSSQSDIVQNASSLKAWIEGLGVGFACTVHDDARRLSGCGLRGATGQAFASQDVKASAKTFVTMFDVHGDWYQQLLTPENVILADNTVIGTKTQNLFFTGTAIRDFLVANNAFHNTTSTGLYDNYRGILSQFAKAHSHVVVVHNTMSTQGLLLRADQSYVPDNYCVIANNVMGAISWEGTAAGSATIADNHLLGGTAPVLSTGTTIGGSESASLEDAAAGRFAPKTLVADRSLTARIKPAGGSERSATTPPGAIAASSNSAVVSPFFGAAQFPLENGEDIATDTVGEFRFSGSGNLAGAGTLALWYGPSTIFAIIDLPLTQYRGLNRTPCVLASTTATTLARSIKLNFYSGQHSTTAKRNRFELYLKGENAGGSWTMTSAALPTSAVGPFAIKVWHDDANGRFDIYDIGAGMWYTGTEVAKPGTWAGVQFLTNQLCVGGAGDYTFPKNSTASPAGNCSLRGAICDVVFADVAMTDQDVEAIVAGVDPVARVGAANCRLHAPLVTASGAVTTAITSTRAGVSMAINGSIEPGPLLRRQSTTRYLKLDHILWPGHFTRGPNESSAIATLTGDLGGVTGTMRAAIVARGGGTIKGWHDVPCTVTNGTFTATVEIPRTGLTWFQILLHTSNDTDIVACTHSVCKAGATINVFGQSETVIATLSADAIGADTALNVRPSGPTDLVSFATAVGLDNTFFLTGTRYRPGLVGDQGMHIANKLVLAAREPVHVVVQAISGTSLAALMDDSAGGRSWTDVVGRAALTADRVASTPIRSTGHVIGGWEAFYGDISGVMEQVYRPFLTGTPSTALPVAKLNHWLFDGTFTPGGKVVVLPCNRVTNSATMATSDGGIEANQRDEMRNYAHILGFEIGPEMTTHKMQGENAAGGVPSGSVTHAEGSDWEGGVETADAFAEAILMAANCGSYAGPVFFESARRGAGSDKVIVTLGQHRRWPGEGLGNPLQGFSTTASTQSSAFHGLLYTKKGGGDPGAGFEVAIDGGSWSRTQVVRGRIVSDSEVELTLAGPFTTLLVRYASGGPGNYTTATISQENWRSGMLFHGGTGYSAGNPAALGYAISGSNAALSV